MQNERKEGKAGDSLKIEVNDDGQVTLDWDSNDPQWNFYQNYHKLRYRNLSTTQSTTDLELLISLARLLNQKVTHLDYTSYLQSHLNTVICELERQQTLRESADLRFIQENNGGHIRKDLDSLGERMFPLGYETTTDNYEHSSYYWDTDRNK